MKRAYIVTDPDGERRQYRAEQLPLAIGGGEGADIRISAENDREIIAYIALEKGHAFIQPAVSNETILHNYERISDSTWLKSGDRLLLGGRQLLWTVQGDQVLIDVQKPEPVTREEDPPPKSEPQRRVLPMVDKHAGKSTHRGLKRSVWGIFLVLLLFAGFLLLSTPVEVRIEPAPTYQALKGFPPALPLAERRLVWPGRYRIIAQREGYFDLDEPVDVPMAGDRNFFFEMKERPGEIKITTEPNVAFQVISADTALPIDDAGIVQLPRGSHALTVVTERYLPVEQQLEVHGLGQQQALTLNLQPAWAEVSLDSLPPGAKVSVDKQLAGQTPLTLELLQGEREVRLSMPLYKDSLLRLDVIAANALDLGVISLSPADGELMLNSKPDGATVQVDNDFRGTTPLSLTLSSQQVHRLKLTKPGYSPLEHVLKLEPEQQENLTLELKPQYGTVFISVDPADARLRIDGKSMGSATRRLRLPTRSHRIEIYKPGYKSFISTITPATAASRNLDVRLKTVKQAKNESLSDQIATSAGQFRLIRPSGSFNMGASRREPGRRANESRRLINLTRAYYFAEKEVTNAEYRRFAAKHASGRAEGRRLDDPQQPVVNVSWDDAARYCNWLSRKEGLPPAYRLADGHMQLVRPVTTGYRLPTEAEWAYVARVHGRAQPARYPWEGSYPPAKISGNFADARIGDTLAEVLPNYDDRYRVSAPVGTFNAFPNGFYDLGGNVAEWVNDYYDVYPGAADRVVENPLGPEQGEHHVVRGSSWRHGNITELRLSYRDYSRKPRDDLGFRLARYAQ